MLGRLKDEAPLQSIAGVQVDMAPRTREGTHQPQDFVMGEGWDAHAWQPLARGSGKGSSVARR
jgi:hypothetical protein